MIKSINKMIDVLLINPNYKKRSSLIPIRDKLKVPPMGLMYLASSLEKAGFKIEILDLNIEVLKNRNILRIIKERSPMLIGITSMTSSIHETYRLAKLIKANFNIPLVIGGPHATFADEEILNESTFDIVVRGEGEETLVELVRTIKKGKTLENIKGITFKKENKIIKNKPRDFISDLDKLPFPARHLVNLEKYRGHGFTVVTSRGCPFGCKFCQVPGKDGFKWRNRSTENIIEELKETIKKYPNIKKVDGPAHKKLMVFFIDDNFMVSIKRVEEICKKIIEERIKIYWSGDARADAIADASDDFLDLLKKSGCIHLYLGIESGSERILKVYNKKIKKEQVLKAAERLKKNGIYFTYSFILGYIIETREDLSETIRFAKKVDPTIASFRILIPLPGTPIYEEYKKDDLITDFNYINYTSAKQIIKHKENLERWALRAYASFYLRPRKIYLDVGMWKLFKSI